MITRIGAYHVAGKFGNYVLQIWECKGRRYRYAIFERVSSYLTLVHRGKSSFHNLENEEDKKWFAKFTVEFYISEFHPSSDCLYDTSVTKVKKREEFFITNPGRKE